MDAFEGGQDVLCVVSVYAIQMEDGDGNADLGIRLALANEVTRSCASADETSPIGANRT